MSVTIEIEGRKVGPEHPAFSIAEIGINHDGNEDTASEMIRAAAAAGADAVLINCSAPEAVTLGLGIVQEFGKPFGGYANAFEQITDDFLKSKPTVDALRMRRDMGPRAYAGYVMEWVGNGATIVGGCCEVSPGHIAEISRRLTAAGHNIV